MLPFIFGHQAGHVDNQPARPPPRHPLSHLCLPSTTTVIRTYTTPHLRRGPVGDWRLSSTSIDRTINGTIFHSERTLRGTALSSGSIISNASFGSSATANRHREAVNVLAHSIAPAISNSSPLSKVRTGLSVAVEEPQHPVDSGSGKQASVGLAVSATVSNAVEVTLPSRKISGKSSVITLALEVPESSAHHAQQSPPSLSSTKKNSHSHKRYHPVPPTHTSSASSTSPPAQTRPTTPS
jgi:hypothetical protein